MSLRERVDRLEQRTIDREVWAEAERIGAKLHMAPADVLREAQALWDRYGGTEEGVAAGIAQELGMTPEQVRAEALSWG